MIILIIVEAIISPHFLKTAKVINIIRQIAVMGRLLSAEAGAPPPAAGRLSTAA